MSPFLSSRPPHRPAAEAWAGNVTVRAWDYWVWVIIDHETELLPFSVSRVYGDRKPRRHRCSLGSAGSCLKGWFMCALARTSASSPIMLRSCAAFLWVKITSLMLPCKTDTSLCFRFIPGQTFWGWSGSYVTFLSFSCFHGAYMANYQIPRMFWSFFWLEVSGLSPRHLQPYRTFQQ